MMREYFSQIEVHGDNALKFCNDYTVSLFELNNEELIPTAFINKLGRVVVTAIAKIESLKQVTFVLPSEVTEVLCKNLKVFAQFSRVELITSPLKIDIGDYLSPEMVTTAPIPWIGDESASVYTASDLSLDTLGWVNFEKGCYLGQEVVSRMHFKVKSKKNVLACLSSDSSTQSILPTCYNQHPHILGVIKTTDQQSIKVAHQIWERDQLKL